MIFVLSWIILLEILDLENRKDYVMDTKDQYLDKLAPFDNTEDFSTS